MSILSVDKIQPIGSGTTVTLNATELKTGTEITVGTGSSIFSPAGNTLTLGTNNVERLRITNDGTFTVQTGGSERARIDSSGRLLIGLTASQTTDSNAHSKLQVATSAGPNIGLGNNSTDINNNGRLGIINFNSNHGGTYHEVGVIASRADADHASNSKPSRLEFYTTSSGNTQATERLRIDSGGRLLIGTTSSTAHTNAGNLQIGDYSAGGAGITINTTTSGSGNIYFGDSSSSIRRGRIEYDHSNDAFRHYTADSERFRIDSSGRVLIGTTTEGEASADNLTIADSGNSGISIRSGTSSWGSIFFSDATSGTDELSGAIEYKHNDNYLRFRTNATERIRITNDGITFNGDTAAANALDDYEEGSYTPTFISSGASFTYNHQYGYYQKVGNTVHVSFYITLHPSLTTVSGTTSNTLHVSVPFTATSATRYEAACCFSMVYKFNLNASAVDDIPLTGRLYSGDNKIDLLAQFDDDAGYAYTAVKANQNGCGLAGSITYRVS